MTLALCPFANNIQHSIQYANHINTFTYTVLDSGGWLHSMEKAKTERKQKAFGTSTTFYLFKIMWKAIMIVKLRRLACFEKIKCCYKRKRSVNKNIYVHHSLFNLVKSDFHVDDFHQPSHLCGSNAANHHTIHTP